MRTFKPCGFDAWRTKMMESKRPHDSVECPDCDGSGVDTCSHCDRQGDCDNCAGEGFVAWKDLIEDEQKAYFSLARYEQALIDDAKAFAGWYEQPVESVLFDAGFIPWCSVHSKQLRITHTTRH